MNKLNKILLATLILLITARSQASDVDDLAQEILANEMIIIYQIDTNTLDNDLADYNRVLKASLKEKCKAQPKKCQHISLKKVSK